MPGWVGQVEHIWEEPSARRRRHSRRVGPSLAGDERFRQWIAKLERLSATPPAVEGVCA